MAEKAASSMSKRVSTASKRTSVAPTPSAPAAPKPPCNIDPAATVAAQAVLSGTFPITINAHAILHPYCNISSMSGQVRLGEGVIIWERASVGAGDGGNIETSIGRNAVIESGARVEAEAVIGEGSVVECNAVVRRGARIGKYCKVAPCAVVASSEDVPDYTIIYGNGSRRRIDRTTRDDSVIADLRAMTHQSQLKGLQTLIPSNIAKWQ